MNDSIVPGFETEKMEGLAITLQRIEEEKGCLELSLLGRVDTYNASGFLKRVMRAIDDGYRSLIFGMGGVDYVSSMGIASFTSILKTVRARNGEMVLVRVQPRVHEVLSLLGFSSFFPSAGSIEQAIALVARKRETAATTYPRKFNCPICAKRLLASRAGRFRCPECRTILALDEAGGVLLG